MVNFYMVYTSCQVLFLTLPVLIHLILNAILEKDTTIIPFYRLGDWGKKILNNLTNGYMS